jgi:hypothetical protein
MMKESMDEGARDRRPQPTESPPSVAKTEAKPSHLTKEKAWVKDFGQK